jgi:ParB family chromosome partitioning protein
VATAAITPPNADGSPRIVGDIIALDAREIDATGRLRAVDDHWSRALGRIMIAEGQRTPIEVAHNPQAKSPWKLVSGGHRHAAAIHFPELNPLRCIEVPAGELDRRHSEIAENLWRRELNPLERAVFVAEMHDVLRARAGLSSDASAQSIAANVRWKKELRRAAGDASAIVADAYGFTVEIADRVGLSKRTIENDLMVARRLNPTVQIKLRGHAAAGNATQLRALARLEEADQSAVVDHLLAGARSVSEALARIANRQPVSAEDRRLSTFIGAFSRMTLSQKRGALEALAGLLPSPFKLVEDK